MRKKYSLDFSIERDIDRLHAVEDILDTLNTDPSATELEQMASYILYGKDENGKNSIQRNETIDKDKRYKSYKTKDDKVQSLDEMMEVPGFDEQQLRSAYKRDSYTVPKPCIRKPKYDKSTGEMIDPGDSDVPGMWEQWEIIDRWQRMLDVAQGKIAPDENDTIISDPYRVYQLKHNLIDIRKHQYYLKDSAKPTLHFQNLDHPKPQFYDWSGDAFYWIPYDKWQYRVTHSYTSRISQNIADYETRGEGDQLEVKWVVCQHTFDWENPRHIRALLNHYCTLYDALKDKLDTYGRTLLWDFDRYVEICGFSELRKFLISLRKQGMAYEDILDEMRAKYTMEYSPNYLVSIVNTEVPNKIAKIAKMLRLEQETPAEERKKCTHCGRSLPADPLFFSRNNAHKDGLSNTCKDCDRANRIKRGVVNSGGDLRKKDPTLPKVQA